MKINSIIPWFNISSSIFLKDTLNPIYGSCLKKQDFNTKASKETWIELTTHPRTYILQAVLKEGFMILKLINIIIARHMAIDSYVKANRVGFPCVLKNCSRTMS